MKILKDGKEMYTGVKILQNKIARKISWVVYHAE